MVEARIWEQPWSACAACSHLSWVPPPRCLILSDTKTIDLPRAVKWLMEAKRMAGRVVWMNPIPENKWPYLRSVQTVLQLCQMIPCSTLSALAARLPKAGQLTAFSMIKLVSRTPFRSTVCARTTW